MGLDPRESRGYIYGMLGVITRKAQSVDLEVLAEGFKLTASEILKALPSTVHCTYPAGTVVVEEGETGSEVYAVFKGIFSVRYSRWLFFSKEIARLKPGELFGEIGLLSPGVRLASVAALKSAEALRLAPAEFKGLLDKNPQLRARVEEQALQRERP